MTLSEGLALPGASITLDECRCELLVSIPDEYGETVIYSAPVKQVLTELLGLPVQTGSEYIPLSEWAAETAISHSRARHYYREGRFGEDAYLDESFPPRGRVMVRRNATVTKKGPRGMVSS